ncbi:vomeronasal receptor 4, partial [Sigmodon hispidus]
ALHLAVLGCVKYKKYASLNIINFQSCLGVLANMFLLLFYTFIMLGHRPKPTDLISYQLTFIHIVMVLTGGDIWLTDIFELLNMDNDFKCKTTFYIRRLLRGLSICITCLLSVFQAVTISPSTSLLAKFKYKLKKYTIYAFLFIWSFNLSLSSNQIFSVGAFTNLSETNQMKVTKYCSIFPMNYIIWGLILTVTTSRDIFLVGVMLSTSVYMVIILCRHQRQCKHLHNITHPRASPEKRATQAILVLVVFFVVMYWMDFIISSIEVLLWMYDPVILTVQKFVMNVYPTVTPLVQISSDIRIIIIITDQVAGLVIAASVENVLNFQSGLGILANMFLLFFYTFIILFHRSKPTDLMSYQLTFIHIVLVITGGDIWLTDIFESLNIENDFKCKVTFYINRVMRGLSICITCLLSVFQAVTISSNISLLAKFKYKLKKYTIYAFIFIWSFNLSFSSNQIFSVGAFTNMTETNQMKVTKYCSLFPINYIFRGLILTVTISRDVFLVGVMLSASVYMVIILCRHQRQCKHLHNINHWRASPENRATQAILVLVLFFVVMYWMDFIISSTAVLLWTYDPVILTVQKFVMNAYPTITPLVQISSDKRIINMLKSFHSICRLPTRPPNSNS